MPARGKVLVRRLLRIKRIGIQCEGNGMWSLLHVATQVEADSSSIGGLVEWVCAQVEIIYWSGSEEILSVVDLLVRWVGFQIVLCCLGYCCFVGLLFDLLVTVE